MYPIPEDLKDAYRVFSTGKNARPTASEYVLLIERIARLESERDAYKRGLEAHAKEADALEQENAALKLENEQLKVQIERVSAPVSDEEWLGMCAGDHVVFADFQRSDIENFIAFRLAAPTE
jgi:hypothetical protein